MPMRILAALVALAVFIPSADAAVIATTKQKKLPVIEMAYVKDDLSGFGFEIAKAPTRHAYDVWMRVTGARNREIGEWFVTSMKLRAKNGKIAEADFAWNLGDVLEYSRAGTYQLTFYVCPANVDHPGEVACAHASAGFTKK